jgi:hypothetical protein
MASSNNGERSYSEAVSEEKFSLGKQHMVSAPHCVTNETLLGNVHVERGCLSTSFSRMRRSPLSDPFSVRTIDVCY